MIIKIQDQYMSGSYLSPDEKPEGFEFFPAFKAGVNTFCYVTDGMTNYITVPFQAVNLPDQAVANASRMVGIPILDSHNLPHGKP